jgi:hypothetical protein
MMLRRDRSNPHLVDEKSVRALERIAFTDTGVNEAWLQRLLFDYPALLPARDLDPAFSPAIALAREVPTGAGAIDLLLVSSLGYLTLVETKLIRNPEARREVVGQVLDYAKELSRWSYQDLTEAVRRAGGSQAADPILEAVTRSAGDTEDFHSEQFRRAVTHGLRHGRFLLLVVGDEISEQVEALVDYLQNFAHLQFTLGLISLALYRTDSPRPWPILVVPRVIARTTEIVRAIVRIEDGGDGTRITVTAPGHGTTTSPSLEAFWEAVASAPDAGSRNALEELFRALEALGVQPDPLQTGIALRFPDPGGSDAEFRLLRITNRGRVRSMLRLKRQLENSGYDGAIALKYVEAISQWVPGTTVNSSTGNLTSGQIADYSFPVKVLSEDHRDEYLRVVSWLFRELQTAAELKTASRSLERPSS